MAEDWEAAFAKDRTVIASDGTRLAYTVRGEGSGVPVVFINGWTCPDAYWAKIGPGIMTAGHPVLYLDVRGHGHSGLPRPPGYAARNLRPSDLDAERLARDVIEVIDDAGLDRVALVGHSMGVQILMEVAHSAPSRVAALVPVAGTFENPVKTFANMALLDRLYPAAEMLFSVLPFEHLQGAIRRTASPEFGAKVVKWIRVGGPKVTPDDVAGHMGQLGQVNLSVLFKMMSQLRRHHLFDFLPSIAAPTLVLAGRKDVFTPPSVQEKMATYIPGAEIVWFEEGGHLLPAEEPDGIIAAVTEFLSRRVSPPSSATRRPRTPSRARGARPATKKAGR